MADTQSLLLAIVAVFSGGTVLASASAVAEPPGRPAPAAISRHAPAEADSRAMVIARASDGLFYIDAVIGSEAVRFLVDTGANMTLLAPQDARRARLVSQGMLSLETAGGLSRIEASVIDRLNLGHHAIGPVRVGIADDGLGVSLLGQDVLSKLGTITIAADSMTIHLPAS